MICQRRLHSLARWCLCKTDKSPTKSGSSRRITQCLSTSITARKPTLFGRLNYPRWRELRRVMSTGPHVTIKPDGHLLMDDVLELGISGLAKQQRVTLHALLKEGNAIFESCCCFTADEYGEVDLATQPSLSGSYTGVSPMGIFWSMSQAPGQRAGLRIMKKDVSTPITTTIAVYNGHLSADRIHATSPPAVCIGSVDRWYMAPGLRREVVYDGPLRGVLYLPQGDGPFPGVIDLFGTAGGILEFRAALLASRGIATLSLPYFAYDDLPESLLELNLDYFMDAIDWMCSHRDIFHDGIGVIGVSKGGDISLMMATYSQKVSCVVNINGCTFAACYGITYNGRHIPAIDLQLDRSYIQEEAIVSKECFEYSKEDLTPVWKSNAKVLNIIGADDQCSPNECIWLMESLYPKDKKDNFQIVSYPGAGHLIEPPYAPLCRKSYNKHFDMHILWGGHGEPHAAAQEDSWHRIQEHFHKYIPRSSQTDLSVNNKE